MKTTITHFFKFAIIGATGAVVNLAALAAIIHLTGVGDWRVSLLASLAGTTNNYFLHNWITFREHRHHGLGYASGFVKFCFACSLAVTITSVSYGLMLPRVTALVASSPLQQIPHMANLVAQFISIGLGTFCNFTSSREFVWRPRKRILLDAVMADAAE